MSLPQFLARVQETRRAVEDALEDTSALERAINESEQQVNAADSLYCGMREFFADSVYLLLEKAVCHRFYYCGFYMLMIRVL